MSKIKDFLENSGFLGRIVALIAIFVWVVNLLGGTISHFWASSVLYNLGAIESGFGQYGFFNIIVSCLALPVVFWAWDLLVGKKDDER